VECAECDFVPGGLGELVHFPESRREA
jgi:hypothetical protein